MFNLSLTGIGLTIFGQTTLMVTLMTDVSCLVQYMGLFLLLFCGYTTVYILSVLLDLIDT